MANHFGNRNYVPKKVVSLAPDALVYINGEETATTCVRCRKESRVVDDITDLSVTVSLEAKNTASFTIIAPRYDKNRWFNRGTPVIKPMHEVEIYMRGRFLVDGEARYYPVFWGCVTSVAHSYSDGQFTLKVDCEGMLRWWEISKINIQPAAVASSSLSSKHNPSPWTNVFGEGNPYDIIWYLANLTTGGLIAPESLTSETLDGDAMSSKFLRDLDQQIMDYWNLRFRQVGRALRMFGFEGEVPAVSPISDLASRGQDKRTNTQMSPPISRQVRPRGAQLTENIESFGPFAQVSKGYDLLASEITSKLEMANQVKNTINYEFYQDVTGEIMFKPPFYNIDVRPFPPYVIEEIDIVSLDVTESESEIYTRIDVRGSWHDLLAEGDASLQPSATYVDPDLAKKFGVRAISVNQNYLRNSEDCFVYAVGELDRLNKRRWSGSMTIKGRPEIRVGFPVYVVHLDTFFYVTSVSHAFTFGSSHNTTLGLEAARRRVYETSKVGRTGAPLKFHVYRGTTTQFRSAELDEFRFAQAVESQRRRDKVAPSETKDQVDTPTAAQQKQESLASGRTVSTQASIFAAPERDDRITRVAREQDGQVLVVPFTDGEGYEVIGGFEYGRNILVNTRGGLSAKRVGITKAEPVGSLASTIEEVDYPTGKQELPNKKNPLGESESFLDAALYMTPKELSESEVASLDPAFDATLESGKSGVTKDFFAERKSILSLEPGLKKRDEASKCVCYRDDKRIDAILQRNSLTGPDTPKRASLQPEVLKDLDRFNILLQRNLVPDDLTEDETTELNRLRRNLVKAGVLAAGEL